MKPPRLHTAGQLLRSNIAYAGRAYTYVFILLLPFLPESISFTRWNVTVSGAAVASLVLILFGAATLLLERLSLKQSWWLLLVLAVPPVLSALAINGRGTPLLLTTAETLGRLFTAAAVMVLFARQSWERIGLLAAIGFMGFMISLLGLGDALTWRLTDSATHLFSRQPDHWSLLPLATGPFDTAEELAWLAAVSMPIAAAAALSVRGLWHIIGSLAIGICWFGALMTYTHLAPIAGLVGTLIVLISLYGRRNASPLISVSIALFGLAAVVQPEFRARWTDQREPILMFPLDVETARIPGAAEDSLQVTLLNMGPLPWPDSFEAGYHLFVLSEGSEGELRLERDGWVGHVVGDAVYPGSEMLLRLPFHTEESRGFVLPDLRGPGGWFGQMYGYPYLVAYRANLEFHRGQTTPAYRVDILVPMRDQELLDEARRMIAPIARSDSSTPLMTAWRDALQFARARPILGFGAGAMEDMLGEESRSLVLEILVSFGAVGLVAFIVLMVFLLLKLVNRKSLEAITLLAILGVILLLGASRNLPSDSVLASFTAVMLGLAFSASFYPDDSPYERWIEDSHIPTHGSLSRFRR
ncbi:hypothetical protein GF324_05800 [bacterium]|nr:hypothetical protein [bacterium]